MAFVRDTVHTAPRALFQTKARSKVGALASKLRSERGGEQPMDAATLKQAAFLPAAETRNQALLKNLYNSRGGGIISQSELGLFVTLSEHDLCSVCFDNCLSSCLSLICIIRPDLNRPGRLLALDPRPPALSRQQAG